MMLFAMLNQTNTEIIRELLRSVPHNLIEDIASCPNHTCFREYLDRKGPSSSEPEGFCMAARCLSLYSFSTFMSCCTSRSSHARIFKSDYTSWMLQFLESSEMPPQCPDAHVTGCRYRRVGDADQETGPEFSLFSLEMQMCKAGTEFKEFHIPASFSLYASICEQLC